MLTEKLGTRYINGMSGSELMKSLIDNAVSAGKDLNLGQGVALTREQINGLKNDILWYEYQTVNGVRTLVPKIYLSKATLERLETDGRSRIYGTDFTVISSGKEINNRGQKIGSDTGITLIKGSRVTNEMLAGERGEIAGRQIQIEASVGNIENIGGKISGEEINLIAKKGNIVNDGVKQRNGYQIDKNNHTQYETVSNVGEITGNSVYLEANDYNTTGGALLTKNLALNLKGDINADAMELKGNDRFGDSRNYQKYSSKEHVGSAIVTEKVTGTVGDINLRGSAFIAENGDKINIGNVRVESAVNEYDTESRSKSRGMLSSRKSYTESHTEENAAGNFKIGSNAHISGTVTSVGSNVYLGENTYVGGKVTTDSRQLHNSYYHEESRRGFNAGAGKGSVSAGYGKNESTYRETGTVNAKSTLHVGNNSVLNSGAEITATDFEHGKIEINNGNVIYGARKDTKDVTSTSKSTNIGITAKVTSPALDRIKQAEGAVKQAKEGDYTGGTVNAINFVTGTVKGLRDNIRSKDGKPARMDDIRKGEFKVNNDFYISGSVNVAFNKSKSESSSHTESAVVTTITGIDKDSGITYNNVDNITYKGTQAKDTKFVYNDVKNITKESVELHNSYRSSSRGMGVGVNTSFGSDGKAKGTTVNISASRSNSNTDETIHHNGSFTNVDEVHNNTGTMIIRGFNQEGGKVTGNIGKLEIESVQNTSTTTGSSRGVNIGISSSGVPTSGSINAGRTNGSRAYVDKQSTFVIGEGSSLTIGRVENTGAIIGKEGNSGLKIDEYTGKDIHNHDTMKTVGITAGTDGAGVNYENSVKEGITRNTVIGSPEIGRAEGAPINTDISKANETTREEHRKTNVFLEPQTIDYAMNPGKFKEDFEVAVLEGKATGEAILKTIENLVNGRKSSDMADPERRTLNEIKESIIRVKTAPQMESIAEAKDLNSPDVLKELGIAAIEKYDPYDPNLPIKIRQRVEKTLEDGKVPGVFYDEITNKIFVYKGMEDDLEIRAGIAREWKISEDLKDGKGKPNEEGRLKATVAGELAYDDMMKRGREGKTGSISTDRFADAVMYEDSEVTADFTRNQTKKGIKELGEIWNKLEKGDMKGVKEQGSRLFGKVTKVLKNDMNNLLYGGPKKAFQTVNESVTAVKEEIIIPGAKAYANYRKKERQKAERKKEEKKKHQQQKKEQVKREQEKRDKEGIEAQENKYKGTRTVDKDTYDYLSDLSKDPEKRYALHDYSIELVKEENGRYTILEKLGDSRTKATQDYLAMKYTRGSKKEVTNSWTLEEVRKEIEQGKAVSSTRLLFITGYGINKEAADKNADKKLEMFGEGAGQTITGTVRTLIGGKTVVAGLATCVETVGVGCLGAGVGLGNVTHGGNDVITVIQKAGHALSDSGYPIKGNVGAEYSRLKKGKGPSVSAENQYRIYNPGVSLIKAIGGTEDDYNVLNMYMGMALPYAISYNSIFNSPSSTGNSGGNTASKSSEKTYTLNSSKSNWNFDSEIPKTVVKNSEGNYELGRGNEWNFDTKYNIPYTETGNKGQGLVSVPSYDAVTNDYSRNYDVFYRTISEKHYKRLLKSGNLPPSGETSIAENAEYSEEYTGINLEFKLKPGTDKQFEKIGVRNNNGDILTDRYPNMKESFPGWKRYGYIQFKEEGNQITRNLGDGKGLEIFNKNIKEINFRKEIIKNGEK